jgi:hypothetical protein
LLVDGSLDGTLITRGSSGQILDRAPFVHGTGVYRIFIDAWTSMSLADLLRMVWTGRA